MPGKRRLQKEATKEHILATATRLYGEKGFATPTQTIAQEAGLSHGAIFVHFPTREDLLLGVLTRFTQEIGGRLHGLAAQGTLSDLLHAHLRVLEEYEPFYKALIRQTPLLPQGAQHLVIAMQSIVSRHFDVTVQGEKKEGRVKDIPPHMLFNLWIGLVHYYLYNSDWFAPGAPVLKRYHQELVDSFMSLISK